MYCVTKTFTDGKPSHDVRSTNPNRLFDGWLCPYIKIPHSLEQEQLHGNIGI